MLAGNALLETLVARFVEMGLPRMAASLEEACRSPRFLEMDRLELVSFVQRDECQERMTTRVNGRLKNAQLLGCGHGLASSHDSAERSYLPTGIANALSTLDFGERGSMSACSAQAIPGRRGSPRR